MTQILSSVDSRARLDGSPTGAEKEGVDMDEKPPSRLQTGSRINHNNREPVGSFSMAVCTKLRLRLVLGTIRTAGPTEQQVCRKVAGKAT